MSRRVLLLLIAGIIAAFTAVSVKNRLAKAPVVQGQTSRVLLARHDLTTGTFVQGASDLDWGPEPTAIPGSPKEEYLHEGSVKLSDFNGAVVRRDLHAGDAVPVGALMKSGEGGFMSAVLDPGMRAVSIAVNATSGNAGFVSPGDHIDLIVTHRFKRRGENNSSIIQESVVSETFVRNVRVVAVDQMIDNPDNKAILAKTVTVEVSPRQAEQIAVAAEMGKISVALRSSAPAPEAAKPENDNARTLTDLYGNAQDDQEDFTRDSDISSVLQHKNVMVPRVQVIRGDQTQVMDFYQDGQ